MSDKDLNKCCGGNCGCGSEKEEKHEGCGCGGHGHDHGHDHHEEHQLSRESHRGNRIIGIMAQHKDIADPKQRLQQGLDKNRPRQGNYAHALLQCFGCFCHERFLQIENE